jgi:hypothetical protein
MPFLKQNKILIQNVFAKAWNFVHCVPEFEFGSEYRSDFLVLCADSGWWYADFVEIKSPKARLYLKDGTPSKSLRIAQREISDWQNWIRKNDNYLRERFSRVLREIDAPAICRPSIHSKGWAEIKDPRTVIQFSYHIVIGRRHLLSIEEQERRMASYKPPFNEQITTFDRLLDAAKRLDDYKKCLKKGSTKGG